MGKKIVKVEALEEQTDCISIELENGSIILLELDPKLKNPLFAEIKRLSLPTTDGESVYWTNGARLTFDEIMEMLVSEN